MVVWGSGQFRFQVNAGLLCHQPSLWSFLREAMRESSTTPCLTTPRTPLTPPFPPHVPSVSCPAHPRQKHTGSARVREGAPPSHPCPTQPFPTLPHPTLHYPALPYPSHTLVDPRVFRVLVLGSSRSTGALATILPCLLMPYIKLHAPRPVRNQSLPVQTTCTRPPH